MLNFTSSIPVTGRLRFRYIGLSLCYHISPSAVSLIWCVQRSTTLGNERPAPGVPFAEPNKHWSWPFGSRRSSQLPSTAITSSSWSNLNRSALGRCPPLRIPPIGTTFVQRFLLNSIRRADALSSSTSSQCPPSQLLTKSDSLPHISVTWQPRSSVHTTSARGANRRLASLMRYCKRRSLRLNRKHRRRVLVLELVGSWSQILIVSRGGK